MKKLVLMAAIAFGSLTAFANTTTPVVNNNAIVKQYQEKFTEIKAEEVPEAVTKALKADYPDATLDKAYVNESKQYKLEVTTDGASKTLYADANGKWIEM
ncbi:hypothetical protein ACG2LH_01365 [Zhouia sp. PK063]|uniref:hypothetical protein n=1 Tax=Zhouia sp. PK063 TaxID=3373602 RepID=UPI003799A912